MSMRAIYKPRMSEEAVNKAMSEELERFMADETAVELDQDEIKVVKEAREIKRAISSVIYHNLQERRLYPLAETENDFYGAYNRISDNSYDGIYQDEDGETYVKHGEALWSAVKFVKIRTLTSQGRALLDQWRMRNHYSPYSSFYGRSYEEFSEIIGNDKYSQPLSLSSLVEEHLPSDIREKLDSAGEYIAI